MVYVPKHHVEKFLATASIQEIEAKIADLKELMMTGRVNERDGEHYLSILEQDLASKMMLKKK